MRSYRSQDLYGSALFANDGDELEAVVPESSKESLSPIHVPLEHESTKLSKGEMTQSASGEGLNLVQKLTFFGIIIGAVALFLKTKKSRINGEKNLA